MTSDLNQENQKRKEKFQKLLNDSELNASLEGHPPSEFDEGLALNTHDDYHDESISRIHTDEEIETVVKELLRNTRKFDARDITATVDNCNVTLSGTVRTQEARDYLISVAKLVHGVGDVHSEIVVKRNEGILPTDVGRNP